jgi:acyl-CoA synthetase (AMP-forming)/AMP-acid ligase II
LVSLLSSKHITSLIHTLLVPLLIRSIAYDFTASEGASRHWNLVDELVDNQITAVLTDDTRLAELSELAKSKRYAVKDNFRIFLLPSKPVIPADIEALNELIVPCYGITEAGGIVAAGAKGRSRFCKVGNVDGNPVLAGGLSLDPNLVRIVNANSQRILDDSVGEIVVQAEQVMSGYKGSNPGRAYLGPDGSLHTGDRGRWFFDGAGKPHIVVLGRENLFFRRKSSELNLFEIERALLKVVGVKGVRVFTFPHKVTGSELAAFVIVSARLKESVTREVLWVNLLQTFSWEMTPKVFMIADDQQIKAIPPNPLLLEKLVPFCSADFSKRPAV